MLTGGSAISCVFCQHGESAILGLVVVVISSSDNRAWTKGVENDLEIYLKINSFFIWVEIRLHTKFQLPVLFRSAVVGLNPIQAGGAVVGLNPIQAGGG